jgi:dienelactone hydrolase
MFCLIGGGASIARSAIKSEVIEYKESKTVLVGDFFYDSEWKEARPVVVIIPQWMGPSDHEITHARSLVGLGYAAFVADVYGKDQRPKNTEEAGKLAGQLKGNVELYRAREFSWRLEHSAPG